MTEMPLMHIARPTAKLALMAALALAGAVALSAGAAPIRLLGVTGQGNAVLIEASEPVAYAVSRPDPLTVLVDLRNVSIADAANQVERRDPIAGVTLEQARAIDGTSLARVRLQLARPSEYKVRSVRNTIRVELIPDARASVSGVPAPIARPAPVQEPADVPEATVLERIRATRVAAATTVTLGGNGRLTPASVSESEDQPRRLVLDFPNVSSKAPSHTSVDGALVKSVRIGVNSRQPLVTRVVMEVADRATYHVERAGADGRDLAVVFEAAQGPGTIMLALPSATAQSFAPEPDIPMQQAIANAAALTPPDSIDPMSALKETAPAPPARQDPPPKTAPPQTAAPRPVPPLPPAAQQPPPEPVPQAAPPPQQAPAQQISAGPQEKRYTGAPVSLDFSGADLRTVLRYFSNISGLNIIIDPSVPATPVDILLTDVPWDQAFEMILRGNKLGYVAEGTILRIAPLTVLQEEETDRRKLSEAKALAGDLRVQTFSLSYAKAGEMQPLLVKSAMSQRGQIQVDTRTNTLIITDLPDRLQTASNLIAVLDRPEPQVEVEARIVQTTRDFARAIGVQWGLNGRVSPAIGNTTPLAFPNSGSLGGRLGGTSAPNDVRSTANETTATAVSLPVAAATSAIGLALGSVNGAFNLDVALSALERSGKGRVLSTPRLTTQNNVPAEVAQGIQIPIQTVANNTVTVTFKDAVLTLKVTPQITSANTVIMQITLENATPDWSKAVNGIPPIDTQRANTQVQVNDGATTIIGGIFVSTEQTSNDRTPLLHRIPLLGWLFKRDSTTDASRELLIFITPRILKG